MSRAAFGSCSFGSTGIRSIRWSQGRIVLRPWLRGLIMHHFCLGKALPPFCAILGLTGLLSMTAGGLFLQRIFRLKPFPV